MLKKGRPHFGNGRTLSYLLITVSLILFVKLDLEIRLQSRLINCKLITDLSDYYCIVFMISSIPQKETRHPQINKCKPPPRLNFNYEGGGRRFGNLHA